MENDFQLWQFFTNRLMYLIYGSAFFLLHMNNLKKLLATFDVEQKQLIEKLRVSLKMEIY